MRTYTYVCTQTCMQAYTCTHTIKHTFIYVHMLTCAFQSWSCQWHDLKFYHFAHVRTPFAGISCFSHFMQLHSGKNLNYTADVFRFIYMYNRTGMKTLSTFVEKKNIVHIFIVFFYIFLCRLTWRNIRMITTPYSSYKHGPFWFSDRSLAVDSDLSDWIEPSFIENYYISVHVRTTHWRWAVEMSHASSLPARANHVLIP